MRGGSQESRLTSHTEWPETTTRKRFQNANNIQTRRIIHQLHTDDGLVHTHCDSRVKSGQFPSVITRDRHRSSTRDDTRHFF